MNKTEMQDELITLLADLQEVAALELVKKRISDGIDPLLILDHCHKGVHLVGELYEKGTYYISGLIMAGERISLPSITLGKISFF